MRVETQKVVDQAKVDEAFAKGKSDAEAELEDGTINLDGREAALAQREKKIGGAENAAAGRKSPAMGRSSSPPKSSLHKTSDKAFQAEGKDGAAVRPTSRP